MNKIWAIIRKDLILRFSSWTELLFFIIMPLFFTFLLSGGTGNKVDNRIRLLVADQAGTPLSAQLIVALENSDVVRPDVLDYDKAVEEFEGRRGSALLIIPAGFTTEALQSGGLDLEIRQQPNNINADAAARAVQAAAGRMGAAAEIALRATDAADDQRRFGSEAETQSFFESALARADELIRTAPDRVRVTIATTADPIEYDPGANSSAGQMITWVFIPLLGLSGVFAYERQQGTLRRLLTTPTSRATFLISTILGQVLTAMFQMALLVTFGIFVMKLNWGREPLALAVMLTSFALCAAALGTTLGTFVKTESQASGLSIMLGMTMAMLGGCWYPLELFPEAARKIVMALPTTWAMQGMLDLGLRGGGLIDILPEAGVLLGFAAVFYVIGVWRFRFE